MSSSFKRSHKLLLQGLTLLAMLFIPFFLYLSAEAGMPWVVKGLLGGLTLVMFFAVWVSGDKKETE
jgi:inner membrane protein involved in colicin E2 resistance